MNKPQEPEKQETADKAILTHYGQGDHLDADDIDMDALHEAMQEVNEEQLSPADRLKNILGDVAAEYGQDEPQPDEELTDDEQKTLREMVGGSEQKKHSDTVGIFTAPPKLLDSALAAKN